MLEQWQKMRAQLQVDEGRRKFPYTDTVGKTSIGVGRNLSDIGVSDATIDQMLDEDIGRAWSDLMKALPWAYGLDPVRQRVLWNMVFNLGLAGFLGFHETIDAVKAGKYDQAADHMLASRWAAQVGPRATRLAQMMRTGQDC